MSEWINIKDLLPDKSGYYLTYSKSKLIRIKKFTARNIYSKNINDHKLRFMSSSGRDCKSTTHWMNLPEEPDNI